MKNKILILGKGFLGQEFESFGFEVWGKDKLQITQETNFSILKDYDVIVNCIGKSNTRQCEQSENWDSTLFSNGILPSKLSKWCKENNKKFVHISTGCLYDKNDIGQTEENFIVAHCKYTVSKWTGECGLDLKRDLILRPRLYFGDKPHTNNLLCKLPKFKRFLTELNSYTNVVEIVKATIALLENSCIGIFNVANEGYLTVFDIAKLLNLSGSCITEKDLHYQEKLYLVNNILNIDKLKKYYRPQLLNDALIDCWKKLNF